MPTTDHLTTVTGAPEGRWMARCTADDCTALDDFDCGVVDLGEALDAAIEHGRLDPTMDIVKIAEAAAQLSRFDWALNHYTEHLIPLWESQFPEKVPDLLDVQARVTRERAELAASIAGM